MKKNFAFSLIELMVVIAIVGLLFIVSVPYYKDYMNKVKTAGIINLARNSMNKATQIYNATESANEVDNSGSISWPVCSIVDTNANDTAVDSAITNFFPACVNGN